MSFPPPVAPRPWTFHFEGHGLLVGYIATLFQRVG